MVATEHNHQLTSRWGGVKRLIALFMCYLAPLNLVVSNCCVGTVYYCTKLLSPNQQRQPKLPFPKSPTIDAPTIPAGQAFSPWASATGQPLQNPKPDTRYLSPSAMVA
jgi:hypothetical protein